MFVKKRLTLFAFYDKDNIIDDYVLDLLRSIQELSDEIIFISNSDIDISESKKIASIVDEIIIRDNIGFDGGCFKDYIEKSEDRIKEFDEVVLTNNSYFGPIYPFEEMFNYMEKENVDYWGITRHKGVDTEDDFRIEHIQAYFLVLRKKIIEDSKFYEFWKEMYYPNNYSEAINNYEININAFLQKNSYKCMAYVEKFGGGKYEKKNVNPYAVYTYELVKECSCPIIKRKSLIEKTIFSNLELLDYLENQTGYNVELIYKNLKREGINLDEFNLCMANMQAFCKNHKKIYIYGNGVIAKRVSFLLERLGVLYNGNIVTEKNAHEDVIEFKELLVTEEVGIIIGVSEKNYKEIYSNCLNAIDCRHLFTFDYNNGMGIV